MATVIDVSGRDRIVVVVPIRSFGNGKLRLSSVLDKEERASLLQATAEGVVAAARTSERVESVLIVSADAEVLSWASRIGPGVAVLDQSPDQPGLNGAVSAGRAWALAANASAVMTLFADLPFLTPQDVAQLVTRREAVVLGPDRHGAGTNALLLKLGGNGPRFQFAFGEGSLLRHVAEAERLGLDVRIERTRGLAFDLDTPDDWSEFLISQTDRVAAIGPAHQPCVVGSA